MKAFLFWLGLTSVLGVPSLKWLLLCNDQDTKAMDYAQMLEEIAGRMAGFEFEVVVCGHHQLAFCNKLNYSNVFLPPDLFIKHTQGEVVSFQEFTSTHDEKGIMDMHSFYLGQDSETNYLRVQPAGS